MNYFLIRPSVGSAIARPRTYLNMVLDESSSMDEVRQETIDAYNAFIESQRHDRVDELFVTLTKFNNAGHVKVVYKAVPIAKVAPLTLRDYGPEGNTALYDGVHATLREIERHVGVNARVLTVVITDGEDNCSREIRSAAELKRIVEAYERRGNWTFVFLAAGLLAYQAGQGMGFAPGNTQPYTDVSDALVTISRGVTGYRHSDDMQTKNFYGAPKFRRTKWAQGGPDPDAVTEG